jgi:excisionase family DNA binding protein
MLCFDMHRGPPSSWSLEVTTDMRDRGWLTVSDVAKILGVTPDAVRDLERRARLRAIRTLGGVRLFRASDVEHLRQRREKQRVAAARELAATP